MIRITLFLILRFEPGVDENARPLADHSHVPKNQCVARGDDKRPGLPGRPSPPAESVAKLPEQTDKPTSSPTAKTTPVSIKRVEPAPKPVMHHESLDQVEMRKFAEELEARGPPTDDGSFKPYAKYPEKQLR